ncbi:unnamed protein product [Brassica rapa]|uniref:Uncharacterized protein n=1 Tax=Brassica campestris TaxID=3711 RepID=A0A3P5Y5Q7_BRACM|nr:unnamed protein product [Brassica rapa]VDC62729.1 unnamed protein product [Brassica rapa]
MQVTHLHSKRSYRGRRFRIEHAQHLGQHHIVASVHVNHLLDDDNTARLLLRNSVLIKLESSLIYFSLCYMQCTRGIWFRLACTF